MNDNIFPVSRKGIFSHLPKVRVHYAYGYLPLTWKSCFLLSPDPVSQIGVMVWDFISNCLQLI